MRIVRPLLAVALTAALIGVSAPVAHAATVASAKGDVTVIVPSDSAVPAGEYQLGLNSSLTGKKSTGGFSLLGPVFVGGRTVLYCPGEVTIIVNEVNPPKKNSYDFPDRYLAIYVEDNPDEVGFLGLNTVPTCAVLATMTPPTTPVEGDIQIG